MRSPLAWSSLDHVAWSYKAPDWGQSRAQSAYTVPVLFFYFYVTSIKYTYPHEEAGSWAPPIVWFEPPTTVRGTRPSFGLSSCPRRTGVCSRRLHGGASSAGSDPPTLSRWKNTDVYPPQTRTDSQSFAAPTTRQPPTADRPECANDWRLPLVAVCPFWIVRNTWRGR